jgi:S1-C subfamily serine protease
MEDAQEPRSDQENSPPGPDAAGGWVPSPPGQPGSNPPQADPAQSDRASSNPAQSNPGGWAPPPPPAEGSSAGGWGPAWPPPPTTGPNPYAQPPYAPGPGAEGSGHYGGWQHQWGAGGGGPWDQGPGAWQQGGPVGPRAPGSPGGPGLPAGPGGPWGQSAWGQDPWGQDNWRWNPPGPPRPRRTLPGAVTALLLVVAVLVGLGLGHGVWRAATSNPPANNGNGFLNPLGNGNSGNSGSGNGTGGVNASSIAAQVAPELVDINTNLYDQSGQAAGTGIVLTSSGLVLTNNHVIAGASQIWATDVGNGQRYPANVVGYDRTHDVALVQMQGAQGLRTATIGDSSKVNVGDDIVGIGNAGGVGGTPSNVAGTVTALNQSITASDEADGEQEQLSGLIQVDANIQPGDSGGSLVNTKGQVIGIDTAASQTFSFATNGSQGFAIPINQAMSIARIIESGRTTSTVHVGATAFLGVYVNTQTSAGSGAQLSKVVANGPAAAAGLAGGDVITSLDAHTVGSPGDLTNLLVPFHPGDRVTVGWSDANGVTHTATVTLAAGPAA